MYRQIWARLGIVMLLFLSGMTPSHLVAEVHAMLPASAQHHASIHCEPAETGEQCGQPQDDITKPLTGLEHERHHEVNCAGDGSFWWVQHLDTVSATPTHWHVVALDFVAPSTVWPLEFPMVANGSRGPPAANDTPPAAPASPHHSGRAPPREA